jgi:hypothetical protein
MGGYMSIKVNCLETGNVPKVEAIDLKKHIELCRQETINVAKTYAKYATGGLIPWSLLDWDAMCCSNFGVKPNYSIPKIKNVIFNDPATIVYWVDGSKTVVKVQPGDTFNKEQGLARCICKKAFGNKGNYNEVFKKWCGNDPCCICGGKYYGTDDGKPYCYDHWVERTGLPF